MNNKLRFHSKLSDEEVRRNFESKDFFTEVKTGLEEVLERTKKKCKCCGNYSLPIGTVYEICSICNWEDDDIQNDNPDLEGGANDMSLNQAKKAYKNGQKVR